MANTTIQIKRSLNNDIPGSLEFGELAYSFSSEKLFVGNQSQAAIVIGGNTYVQIVDAATSSNTSSTLVKRDASGNFSASTISAELDGNAATSTKWKTSRLIGVSGDASGQVSVDGSANANVPLTLATVNATTGIFGGVTNIPVINVNEKGLITSVANVDISVSTSLDINADTGTGTIDLLSEALTFEGGDGLTSNVSANTVTFVVDNTVLRTSGNQSKTGDLTILGDLNVSGNTTFTGNTYFMDIEHYTVSDPLIYLAANNYTSDLVSIGFAANYYDGVTELHTGLFRQPQSNTYFLFTGVSDELSASNEISPSANGFTIATLVANIDQGYVANLSSAIAVTDGGTNSRTIGAAGSIAYSNGTSYLFNSAGTTGQSLVSGGTSSPSFGTLDLRGGGLGITTANTNSVLFYSGSGNVISNTNTPSDGHVLQYSINSGVQFGILDGGIF